MRTRALDLLAMGLVMHFQCLSVLVLKSILKFSALMATAHLIFGARLILTNFAWWLRLQLIGHSGLILVVDMQLFSVLLAGVKACESYFHLLMLFLLNFYLVINSCNSVGIIFCTRVDILIPWYLPPAPVRWLS